MWSIMKSVITLLIVCEYSIVCVFGGSCREANLCCNGRDSSCVVQKAPLNAIIEDLNDKPCYCDHACLKLGDCCTDFKDHCRVTDCIVTEWGPWSECSAPCGSGMMTRSRSIEQKPQNGGKHCPSLVQKRGCQGFKCHSHSERRAMREMAMLLPAALSKSRHENDTHDIRKNLRLRYKDTHKHNREHEYCVDYEVLKASKACRKIPPYNLLMEGERITVRCDLEAQQKDPSADEIVDNSVIHPEETSSKSKYRCRGEGLPGRHTRWSSFAVPSCRGKWIRLSVNPISKCNESQFIFI